MYKLLLVEDHPIIINGLSSIIKEGVKDVDLDYATSFAELEAKLEVGKYNLIICGLPISEARQMGAIMRIIQYYTATSMLIFSDDPDNLPSQKLYSAGVGGILDKRANTNEIQEAILQVYTGNIYINNNFKKKFFSQHWEGDNPFQKLTTREGVVVKLLLEGKSNIQICQILTLQPSTISTFKTNIFNKLQINNLIELEKIGRKAAYCV